MSDGTESAVGRYGQAKSRVQEVLTRVASDTFGRVVTRSHLQPDRAHPVQYGGFAHFFVRPCSSSRCRNCRLVLRFPPSESNQAYKASAKQPNGCGSRYGRNSYIAITYSPCIQEI